MVSYCAVSGCENNSEFDANKSYYKIPVVVQDGNTNEKLLSLLRQQAWIANLSYSNLNVDDLDAYRVCSDHFVQGEPCSLHDVHNKDWVPTLKLCRKVEYVGIKEKCPDSQKVGKKDVTSASQYNSVVQDSRSKSVDEYLKNTSDIRGKKYFTAPLTELHLLDHSYSKIHSVNGDVKEADSSLTASALSCHGSPTSVGSPHSSRTASAGSPPFYYSSDDSDEDLIFISAPTVCLSQESASVSKEKSSMIDFVEKDLDEQNISLNSPISVKSLISAMEVIDLNDDDDIIIEEVTPKKSSASKRPFRCLNSDCQTEDNLILAEGFVRRHFGVLPYPKKRRVCHRCYNEAQREQDSLVEVVKSGRLLLAEKLPPPKTSVVLTDSGSDPSDNEEFSDGSDLEVDCDEGKTLEETIESIMTELQLKTQMNLGVIHLDGQLEAVADGFDQLNAEYATIEEELNNVRVEFYNNFRPEIRWLPALDIGPSSSNIQNPDEGSDIIAEVSTSEQNETLPPIEPLKRPELKLSEACYCMKYSLMARWLHGQVIEVDKREPNNTFYKIRFSRYVKGSCAPRVLPGRCVAYYNKCPTRIPVGTRVIAKFKENDPNKSSISGSFYVGVVAEIPTAANKYRYLIFFDDGYAQYVHHNDIRVVTESSDCPWEDVSVDSKLFIKEYLQMYPERPMVRLHKDNFVKTEWNGKWWKAKVLEVDGSLVNMCFLVDGRTEWIYRGSTRLSPLFQKKFNLQVNTEQCKTIRRRTGKVLVEYGTFGQDQEVEQTNQSELRAIARKSTCQANTPTKEEIQIQAEYETKGTINTHILPEKTVKYQRHICSSCCRDSQGDFMGKFNDVSPLLYPIRHGWKRLIVKQRRKGTLKDEILYVAPCGLRLRNMEEVFQYIVATESSLEIDYFSFAHEINVPHEWEPFKKISFSEDITNGEEDMKISHVNSLEDSIRRPLAYCNVRLPTEHVPLNLDPGFLVNCDCLDNCQDKSNCSCHQLTVQGTRILNQKEDPNVGYHHRRLYNQVQSGIYECNSRCMCAKTRCFNRVVQLGLRQKLQVFKTVQKGWGVRTLCDIPRGGFICIYVGKMLSENTANEEGKLLVGGDDYYAELDYIEIMENAKEGYEEEAITPEEESSSIVSKDSCTNSSVIQEAKATLGSSAPSDDEGIMKDDEETRSSKTESVVSHEPSEDEDDEDGKQRQPQTFLPSQLLGSVSDHKIKKSLREYYGEDESVYIMDARETGNVGRYLNHSCDPNVFVQNVFVDTHDLRFPWVTFFARHNIRAGTELTWDYNYEVGSVPGKIKYCYCGAKNCRGRLL